MRGLVCLLLFVSLILSVSADQIEGSRLAAIREEMKEGRWGSVDRVLLVHRGETVFDESFPRIYHSGGEAGPYNYEDTDWHPFRGESQLHTVQSITKSVLATVVAAAIQRGLIEGLDRPINYHFRQQIDEILTLRHLLSMTAGFDWDEESDYGEPGNDWSQMEESENWLGYALSKPLLDAPGSKFNYNSGLPQLVAEVLVHSTDTDLEQLASHLLFEPLGIEDVVWKRSASGEVDAQGGLYLDAESLAKIGQLYLQDGMWEGERVLPEGWLEEVIEARVSAYEGLDYSLGWWVLSHEDSLAVAGIGYRGQRIYIVPESEVVLVYFSWNVDPGAGPTTGEILARFMRALEQP